MERDIAEALARGDRDRMLELCDAVLLQWPDDRRALWNAAVIRAERGEIEAAAEHYARIDAIESGGVQTARALRTAFMNPEKAARKEPYVAVLENVAVDTSHWSVVCGDRLFSQETHARSVSASPFVRGRVSPDGERCVMTLPREPPRIEQACILLGSDANYAHWVLRNLLKLSLLESAAVPPSAHYVVRQDLRPWQQEYLELLGIREERLLRVPEGRILAFRTLFVPVNLLNHPRIADGVAWLRSRVAPHLASAQDADDQLLVSRREHDQRRLLNEPDLEAALKPLGFRTIVPGRMSVRDQIAAFSRARVVVAAHGAALANMVFAPRTASLVEISSVNIAGMGEIRYLCHAVGQRVSTVVSTDVETSPVSGGRLKMHRDYRVDIDEVMSAVAALL